MPFDPAAALVALDTVLAGLTTLTLGYLFYVCTREGAFEPQKGMTPTSGLAAPSWRAPLTLPGMD